MTGPGEYGAEIGTSSFPFTFSYDWGSEPVFGGYRDYIGFKASCELYIPTDMTLTFQVKANDRIALDCDGQRVMYALEERVSPPSSFMGPLRTYRAQERAIPLRRGWHKFELWYYEWEGEALVSFDFDIPKKELFFSFISMGQEMETLLQRVKALENRVELEEIHRKQFEELFWLMKKLEEAKNWEEQQKLLEELREKLGF